MIRQFSLRRLVGAGAGAAFLVALAGCATTRFPVVTSPQERLMVARKLADEGDCVPAIELLKTYISTNSGSADVDQAVFFLGLCYLKTKDYVSAGIEFERLIRDYPESDSAAAASFRLGDALFGQTRPVDFDQEFTVRAITQWNGYLRAFPGHWRNEEARARVLEAETRLASKAVDTGTLYLKLRLYGPARAYFNKVLQEYPRTPQVGDAVLGLAFCDVEEGRREEAIRRLRDIEKRFEGWPVAARAAQTRKELEN